MSGDGDSEISLREQSSKGPDFKDSEAPPEDDDDVSISYDDMIAAILDQNMPTNPRIEAQRLAFNKKAFGYDELTQQFPAPKKTSVQMDAAKYQLAISLLTAPKEVQITYTKQNKTNYNWIAKMGVETIKIPNSTKSTQVLYRKTSDDPNKRGQLILPMHLIFGACYASHLMVGHCKVISSYKNLKKIVWNHTRQQSQAFIATCPVCLEKAPTIKPLKGAAVPIRSVKFRDRVQVDLIDFRKHSQKNSSGALMRWLVVIKDHHTAFTVVDCIARKRAFLVAEVLMKQFSVLGFPHILHTDNGKEFTAKEVVKKMKAMSPNLTTVTGRPRTPRDQGSVERTNRVVKDMLYAFERDQRINGETPNWVYTIPNVNAAINAREGEGKHGISSYEVVFNMPFHDREQVLPTVLRKCETVNQRVKFMKDSKFNEMLRSNGWQDEFMSDDEEDQTCDTYWSDTSSVS